MEPVIFYKSVPSTNDLAKQLAAAGAVHGTAVAAGEQTAGRGRMGRSFLSPEGGVYLSVILRPEGTVGELLHLTPVMAVAACDAVETVCGVRPGVKWVNDLVLDGKKLAGILTELALKSDGRVDYAVCGIGVNCNAGEEAFSPEVRQMATSLLTRIGRRTDVSLLARELARRMTAACGTAVSEKERWMERYRRDCVTLGKQVRVCAGGEDYPAVAEALDEDGGLWVRRQSGQTVKLSAGEVSVRGMYGYI